MKNQWSGTFWVLLLVAGVPALATERTLSLKLDDPQSSRRVITELKRIREEGLPGQRIVIESLGPSGHLGQGPKIPSVTTPFPMASPWGEAYERADRNGDMYILWGNLTDSWTEEEYGKFYSVIKWLVSKHFRTIVNPVAVEADVREAVTHPLTAGILWSSHGDEEGRVYTSVQQPLSSRVFAQNAGSSFRHIVFSNCYGEQTIRYYALPGRVRAHYWRGLNTTDDFFNYLYSSKWDRDLADDLGILL